MFSFLAAASWSAVASLGATPLSSAGWRSSASAHTSRARQRCRRCNVPLHLCHRTPQRSRARSRKPWRDTAVVCRTVCFGQSASSRARQRCRRCKVALHLCHRTPQRSRARSRKPWRDTAVVCRTVCFGLSTSSRARQRCRRCKAPLHLCHRTPRRFAHSKVHRPPGRF